MILSYCLTIYYGKYLGGPWFTWESDLASYLKCVIKFENIVAITSEFNKYITMF